MLKAHVPTALAARKRVLSLLISIAPNTFATALKPACVSRRSEGFCPLLNVMKSPQLRPKPRPRCAKKLARVRCCVCWTEMITVPVERDHVAGADERRKICAERLESTIR